MLGEESHMYVVGDVVKRNTGGYEGEVEAVMPSEEHGQVLNVRSGGALYELTPKDVTMLRPRRMGQPFKHPVEIPVECIPKVRRGPDPACVTCDGTGEQPVGDPCPRCRAATLHPPAYSVRIAGVTLTATQPLEPGSVVTSPDDWLPAGTLIPLHDPPPHTRDGRCEACNNSYCLIREQPREEPAVRCAGCNAPATDHKHPHGFDPLVQRINPPDGFHGGGLFAMPIKLNDRGCGEAAWDDGEESWLCPACGPKVAAFIKHLRDTHGGKR